MFAVAKAEQDPPHSALQVSEPGSWPSSVQAMGAHSSAQTHAVPQYLQEVKSQPETLPLLGVIGEKSAPHLPRVLPPAWLQLSHQLTTAPPSHPSSSSAGPSLPTLLPA